MFERCLYFNLNAAVRAVNRIWDEAFGRLGLSPAHAYAVRAVLAEPGIAHKQLAETLGLAPSTVSRFVDALETRGLIRREKSEQDGRELRVYPTDDANRLHDTLEQTGEALYARMRDALGSEELVKLVTELRRVKSDLSREADNEE